MNTPYFINLIAKSLFGRYISARGKLSSGEVSKIVSTSFSNTLSPINYTSFDFGFIQA